MFICVADDEELLKPDTISRQIPNFIESVGLRRITLHNLRHSCASILLANGVSMKEIQEWLGHSSYNTTANIYTHVDKKSKENSAETISNVFSKKKRICKNTLELPLELLKKAQKNNTKRILSNP